MTLNKILSKSLNYLYNMKNLILSLIILMCLQSCEYTPEEQKIDKKLKLKYYSELINDTITLNDNHLYYLIKSSYGYNLPIHSQYCKNHK